MRTLSIIGIYININVQNITASFKNILVVVLKGPTYELKNSHVGLTFLEISKELYVYDNSTDRSEGSPEPIIRHKYGHLETLPNSIWSDDMISQLINGTFIKDFEL